MGILLGTSFLLPSLGVEVPQAAETLGSIKEHDLYYSKFKLAHERPRRPLVTPSFDMVVAAVT